MQLRNYSRILLLVCYFRNLLLPRRKLKHNPKRLVNQVGLNSALLLLDFFLLSIYTCWPCIYMFHSVKSMANVCSTHIALHPLALMRMWCCNRFGLCCRFPWCCPFLLHSCLYLASIQMSNLFICPLHSRAVKTWVVVLVTFH